MPRSVLCVALVCSLFHIGCTRSVEHPYTIDGHVVDEIEVYFRDFNVLSYMPYSENELIRNHEIKITISDPAKIKLLIDQLPKDCIADKGSAKDAMNLYALIQFYGQHKQLAQWRYSRFHYDKSSKEVLCKMDDVQRDQIKAAIVQFDQMGRR